MTAPATSDNLGANRAQLARIVDQCGERAVLVELGVDRGVVTRILLSEACERGNVVHGVDLTFRHLPYELMAHRCHRRIRGDSVTAGLRWTGGLIDVVFIDTLHVMPQVLCELHAWTPHLRPGGFIVAHDTAWPDDRRDLTWHRRVGEAGASWPTPDHALARFFDIEDAFNVGKHTGFCRQDGHKTVAHHPDSWGMTVVQIHDPEAMAAARRIDWPATYREREGMLRLVLGDAGLASLGVDRDPLRATRPA